MNRVPTMPLTPEYPLAVNCRTHRCLSFVFVQKHANRVSRVNIAAVTTVNIQSTDLLIPSSLSGRGQAQMSELSAFVHGIVLALGLIVALGPQNIFIFQQGAVQPRFQRVLPSIMTAGIADTVLISLAVGGVSAVILRLEWLRALLFGAGVLFLLYLGWEILFGSTFDFDIKSATAFGARRQVMFTAAVTVLNPGVVIDVIAVIGTNALHYTGIEKWVFAGGCILVSWLWFVMLTVSARFVGLSVRADQYMRWLNYAAGLIIWAIAAYMGWQFLHVLGIH